MSAALGGRWCANDDPSTSMYVSYHHTLFVVDRHSVKYAIHTKGHTQSVYMLVPKCAIYQFWKWHSHFQQWYHYWKWEFPFPELR
jgi:hypothetical protein